MDSDGTGGTNGTGYRTVVAQGMSLLARVADDLLGSDGTPDRELDVAARREQIRDAMHRAHQRGARVRPIVSRRG